MSTRVGERRVEGGIGMVTPTTFVKGAPVRLFNAETGTGLSTNAVDCRNANGLSISVIITGTITTLVFFVQGAVEFGGPYLTLPDPRATQALLTSSTMIDTIIGANWAKVLLFTNSGTYSPGQGITMVATPYLSPSNPSAGVSIQELLSGTNALNTAAVRNQMADSFGSLNSLAVTAWQMGFDGSFWQRRRLVTTVKTVQATGLANGAIQTLWTPASGKSFRLRTVAGRSSWAQRATLRDGAGTLAYIYLPANDWRTLIDLPANGYLSTAANNTLDYVNGAGAADVDFVVAGSEE